MKKTILLMIVAIMAVSTNVFAQHEIFKMNEERCCSG